LFVEVGIILVAAFLALRGSGIPVVAWCANVAVLCGLTLVALRWMRLGEARLRRMIADAAAAKSRAEFLSDVTQMMSTSLDYRAILDVVARLSVARLSDWCEVMVMGPMGTVSHIARAHINPEKEARAIRLLEFYPPSKSQGIQRVLKSGKSELYGTRELLAAVRAEWSQEEIRMAAEHAGISSAMVVPMTVGGRVLGVMTLVATESGRQYKVEDLHLAEELAGRAALAVDHARLYREATMAIDARDEFISIASHELKTPLTSLQLQVASLNKVTAQEPSLTDKLGAKFAVIERQVDRLTRIIDNLLDVSRAAAGRLTIEPEQADLRKVVDEVVARLREQLAKSGSALNIHAEDSCPGTWDPFRLEQIVTNLLTNAIKYGRGQPIELSLWTEGEQVLLRVRDHGIGIATDDQRRIFERFERAVSRRHFGGFGLGLWIVNQIISAMGGNITVKSALGEGAEFTVSLPRRPVAAQAAPVSDTVH
jgi:signal transduction histidine kinase